MKWILLILSLPTQNATVRMRVWRTLKSAGAAVLRDGVYLLPQRQEHQQLFDGLAQEVEASEGSAYVLIVDTEDASQFSSLFDRRDEYANLLQELPSLKELAARSLQEATRQLRKLRKNFTAIAATDFFPSEAQAQSPAISQRTP
jgi:DNA-binding transcriptional regulator PaaX